jgi:hypothetical protein
MSTLSTELEQLKVDVLEPNGLSIGTLAQFVIKHGMFTMQIATTLKSLIGTLEDINASLKSALPKEQE